MTQGTKNEVEGGKPTQPKGEPTEKTRTEEDFQKAVSTGVSKGLESIQRQLDLQKGEADKNRALASKHEATQKHSQAYIESLKKEMEKLSSLTEDEDVRKAYVSSMSSLEREMKIAEREADADQKFYDAQLKERNLSLAMKAKELMDETSIPLNELENCQTEADMEIIALKFQIANPKKAEDEKTPQFDSNLPSGGNRIYTQEQIANMKIEEYEKERPEIDKAFREGRIK